MDVFCDKDGRYFSLLPEVWKHIAAEHPEIEKYLNKIGATLANPLLIKRSRYLHDRHLYYQKFSSKLFFVVLVDTTRNIIKTAYITDRIKEGELIWQSEKK